MVQVLMQIVADDQGEVRLEYLAELVRLLPPEEIVRLLTHVAAELDKDAKEVQAGLTAGTLPPWVSRRRRAGGKLRPAQPVPVSSLSGLGSAGLSVERAAGSHFAAQSVSIRDTDS